MKFHVGINKEDLLIPDFVSWTLCRRYDCEFDIRDSEVCLINGYYDAESRYIEAGLAYCKGQDVCVVLLDKKRYLADPKEYAEKLTEFIVNDRQGKYDGTIVIRDYQRSIKHAGQDPYEIEVQEIARQIKELVQQLHDKGVEEDYIRSLISEQPKLSRIEIDDDYRILLPDFDLEVEMEPMNKAVYLLFLRHPEGIAFKDMIDHRQELREIYLAIRRRKGDTMVDMRRVERSLDALCNPLSNSLNEKCSRIKATFMKLLQPDIASHYYIDGSAGMPRRISLKLSEVELN